MKRISIPDIDSSEIFKKCVNSFRENSLYSKHSLLSLGDSINVSHDEYKKLGELSTLHSLNQNTALIRYENLDDFEKLYNEGLSNKNKKIPYSLYQKIKNRKDENGYEQKCSFCCIHPVKELDHFLPKSIYKTLSVEPLNLLPICRNCNKEKADYLAHNISLIHPYFDNPDDYIWLHIDIETKNSKILPIIKLVNNSNINQHLWNRIIETTEKLKLIDLYKSFIIDNCTFLRNKLEEFKNINECLVYINSEIHTYKKSVHKNHPVLRLYEGVMNYIQKFSNMDSLLADD